VPEFLNLDTGSTLSPFSAGPGQDKRFPITSSDSVFTFGDFKIQRPNIFDNVELLSSGITFSTYSTLDSFSSTTIETLQVLGTAENELNPDVRDPKAYSYFGSFYTKISRAINSVIETFPYAILINTNYTDNTIFGYTGDSITNTSVFKAPFSAISNQGNLIYVSGMSETTTTTNLYRDYPMFTVQLSGTGFTTNYNITSYRYETGTTGFFEFTVNGLFLSAGTTSVLPFYIRPSPEKYSQYQRHISNLEYQVAFVGTFKVPNVDNERTYSYETYEWPREIDGFNIDTIGTDYDNWRESLLLAASRIDETETAWMVRTMIPEQFIELDTDTQIYQKLISTYGEEFDKIKAYIDNLAFMHTVNPNNIESVPNKFMFKLSKMLSFNFHDAFSDVDLFEYFLFEDSEEKTLQDYNFELWRKMLANIVWLYKKKGTRDALMFIFKLMGAPDNLVSLNEFIYTIERTANTVVDPNNPNDKIAPDGFPNYDASQFIFQEGGSGRGNGQKYINQWKPEYTPAKSIDNIKVHTGDTTGGTRNIMNTKEVQVALDPAGAIESDIKEWFELSYQNFAWGGTGFTTSPFADPIYSASTVPSGWSLSNRADFIVPTNITAMTISEWLDFVYTNNTNPVNRKTSWQYSQHNSNYLSLKSIYMTYMLWTNGEDSNKLTFGKLEDLLSLLERNYFNYIQDFVPSTSILEQTATVYRNTLFERQKFVYKEGINAGSEFQKPLPDEFDPIVYGYVAQPTVNDNFQPVSEAYSIRNAIVDDLAVVNQANRISSATAQELKPITYGFSMLSEIFAEEERNFTTGNDYYITTTNYTSGNTVVNFYGGGL
jgi:hypothetical protein